MIAKVKAERIFGSYIPYKAGYAGIPQSPVKQKAVGYHPSCFLWSLFHSINGFSCNI